MVYDSTKNPAWKLFSRKYIVIYLNDFIKKKFYLLLKTEGKKCTNLVLPVQRRFFCKEFDSCKVFLLWEIKNKEWEGKMLKSAGSTIEKILHLIFTEKNYISFSMTFIEWNLMKTKQQVIFQKVLLHSLKNWLIQILNIYFSKYSCKASWCFTYELFCLLSTEKNSK